MARMRTLKPGFFSNPDLLEVEPLGRLLFAGLWCYADREGRLEDRPKKIKLEVLPGDNCDVDAMLQELHDLGFVLRYEVAGKRYIQIPSFSKHQRPHVKEAASIIPAPGSHGPGSTPTTTKDRASTNLGEGEHAWDLGDGIRGEGSGDLDQGCGVLVRAHEAGTPARDDEHPTLDETTAPVASSQTPQPGPTARRQNDEVPPRRAPLRAMAHVEAGPWRFTADHLEALDAAAEGQGFEARDLPGRIGAAIGKRVSWGKNPAETFDAWYALTEDQVVAWCEEAMRRARHGGSDPRNIVGLAAAIAADKLTVGADLTAKVVQLPAAPSGGQSPGRAGRPMSNQERTMAVLHEAMEDERRRMAGGGS